MDTELILLIAHVVGTILGIGGATMIEIHLNQAQRDKLVSADERAILAWDYKVVRVGLIVAILSGFGLLLYHRYAEHFGIFLNPLIWAKMLMVLIIGANTLLLQARKVGLYWGSAFSFVSWWTVGIIGVCATERVQINFFGGESFPASFASIMLVYVVSVLVGAVVLDKIRKSFKSEII